MRRAVLATGWLWAASLAPCGAATVQVDILTSFPITMPRGDTPGDLAYSPTSNTLLVVPADLDFDRVTPYYREFSAAGELLRTVELPTCIDDFYSCLNEVRLIKIEMDPSTPTLIVAQLGPVGGEAGTSDTEPDPPVNWPSVFVYSVSPTERVSLLFDRSFPSPGSGFAGLAVNPVNHTFRFFLYERFFEVDYAGNVVKEGPCDLTYGYGMTFYPEENRYCGIGGLDIYSEDMTLVQRVPLPPELFKVQGITHGVGDVFWFSTVDTMFKVRIRYLPPTSNWILY